MQYSANFISGHDLKTAHISPHRQFEHLDPEENQQVRAELEKNPKLLDCPDGFTHVEMGAIVLYHSWTDKDGEKIYSAIHSAPLWVPLFSRFLHTFITREERKTYILSPSHILPAWEESNSHLVVTTQHRSSQHHRGCHTMVDIPIPRRVDSPCTVREVSQGVGAWRRQKNPK